MTTTGPLRAPFPWFGGKRRSAARIWERLGDPGGYIEPFTGTAVVLLNRPPAPTARTETINDADSHLVNALRAIKHDPERTAAEATGPLAEADIHARAAWLNAHRPTGPPDLTPWIEGDPEHYDPRHAAWWLTVIASGIGNPLQPGPWTVVDGHLTHTGNTNGNGIQRNMPALGSRGRGVHRPGIQRKMPRLSDPGQSVYAPDRDLLGWFARLSDRLAHVRILCGDWTRALGESVLRARHGGEPITAVFLDPPYSDTTTHPEKLYPHSGQMDHLSDAARNTGIRLAREGHRVIIAGHGTEHDQLLPLGWTVTNGHTTSGYAHDKHAERLWCSPNCLTPHTEPTLDLDL